MRRSPVHRNPLLIIGLIAAAVVALLALVLTVVVGESLPGTPATPAVPGTETARFPRCFIDHTGTLILELNDVKPASKKRKSKFGY